MNGVKDYITAVKNDICHGNEDKCRPGRIWRKSDVYVRHS
jgi:hypothetical protein